VLSNQAQCVNTTHNFSQIANTSADTNTANYFAQYTITAFNRLAATSLYTELAIRGNAFGAGGAGYAASVGFSAAGAIDNRLYLWNDDSTIDTDTTIDVSGGGTLRIEASGSNLTVKWNGTPFMTATDSTHAGGPGNRKAAIAIYTFDVTEVNDTAIDSFSYGDL
jgi:hypothetical protein